MRVTFCPYKDKKWHNTVDSPYFDVTDPRERKLLVRPKNQKWVEHKFELLSTGLIISSHKKEACLQATKGAAC